jgi:glucose dehydrogenase
VYDRIVGDTSVSHKQHLIGNPVTQTLYDGTSGNRAEILSVVNGSEFEELHSTNNQIGMYRIVVFDRATGKLTVAFP